MLFKQAVVASFLLAASELVAGHGAITGAVGDQGGSGSAIGSEYILICILTGSDIT